MIDRPGIGHLFEQSGAEATAGSFAPLAVFDAFLPAQPILPAPEAPGCVVDP